MKAAAACNPLLRVAAVTAGLTSGSACAAEWTYAPASQLYTLAQQNPRLGSDDKETATALGAQASLRIQRRTERLDLSIQPTFDLQRYQQDADLDRNNQQLDATLAWRGERVLWNGTASASRDTTLTSELGTTGRTQVNQRHEGADITLGPMWQASERVGIGSNLAWQIDRYPERADAELANSRYGVFSAFTQYTLSDRTRLTLTGSVGRLTSGGLRPDSDNASVRLQGRYSWSPLWMLTVGAGPSWVRRERGNTERGVVYNVDVERSFERSSFAFKAERSQSPSGLGLLSETDEVSLAWSMQLSERLSAGLNAGVSRRKDALPAFRVDIKEVTYGRADLNMSWRAAEHWALSASVGNDVQRADVEPQGQDTARGYQARITLSWTGDPYVK
jgi:hypothetical protein